MPSNTNLKRRATALAAELNIGYADALARLRAEPADDLADHDRVADIDISFLAGEHGLDVIFIQQDLRAVSLAVTSEISRPGSSLVATTARLTFEVGTESEADVVRRAHAVIPAFIEDEYGSEAEILDINLREERADEAPRATDFGAWYGVHRDVHYTVHLAEREGPVESELLRAVGDTTGAELGSFVVAHTYVIADHQLLASAGLDLTESMGANYDRRYRVVVHSSAPLPQMELLSTAAPLPRDNAVNSEVWAELYAPRPDTIRFSVGKQVVALTVVRDELAIPTPHGPVSAPAAEIHDAAEYALQHGEAIVESTLTKRREDGTVPPSIHFVASSGSLLVRDGTTGEQYGIFWRDDIPALLRGLHR